MALLWCTVDASGNAYLTGYTDALDFRLTSPLVYDGFSMFVTTLDPSGSSLVYSTRLKSFINVTMSTAIAVGTDVMAPSLDCATADGLRHASDVSIACTASDGGSGLPNPADAEFSLSTSVAALTETANASTGSREVCDGAGNCAVVGPMSG